jgi:primosomal protein N' (replication factor Y)
MRGRSCSRPATRSTSSSPGSSTGRRELGYPPFRHLLRVVVSGPALTRRTRCSRSCARGSTGVDGDLLGPAPLLRLRNRSRAQLLVKTANPRPIASGRRGSSQRPPLPCAATA